MLRACAVLTSFLLLLFGAPGLARADVVSCVEAHASGQREAKAGHLKAALTRFTECGSNSDCPEEIRADCVAFFSHVAKSVPTVIFVARDANGVDVANVRVYSAGELLVDGLNGRAVELDPGHYRLKFTFASGESVELEILVHEGEKNRIVSVRAPPPRSETGAPAARAGLPTSFWITAGVGAAGLTSWGVFGLLGRGQQAELDECAPSCPESQRGDFDAMRRNYLIADLSLGVGLVSSGVAAVIYFSERRAEARIDRKTRSSELSVVPFLGRSRGGLVLRGTLF